MLRAATTLQSTPTSTMASEQGTLPHVCLDPSRRLISLIDLCRVQDGVPCDWRGLFNKAIQHQHLRPLVSSIGFLVAVGHFGHFVIIGT
jgi:hypothetical protein